MSSNNTLGYPFLRHQIEIIIIPWIAEINTEPLTNSESNLIFESSSWSRWIRVVEKSETSTWNWTEWSWIARAEVQLRLKNQFPSTEEPILNFQFSCSVELSLQTTLISGVGPKVGPYSPLSEKLHHHWISVHRTFWTLDFFGEEFAYLEFLIYSIFIYFHYGYAIYLGLLVPKALAR